MKKIVGILMICAALAIAGVSSFVMAYTAGVPSYAPVLFVLSVVGAVGMAKKHGHSINGFAFNGIDVSALATTLVKYAGSIIMSRVNTWDPGVDFQIAKNVKVPLALPKISTSGEPRPYRKDLDDTGNGVDFTDRKLTVNQTKWDFVLDPEVYRNTYLAEAGADFDPNNMQFYVYLATKIADDYLANLNNKAIYAGVYDPAGSGTVDLLDGLVETLTNAGLTPVATGAITALNAVTKIEQIMATMPAWMRSAGAKAICSWRVFDFYKAHYRSLNPYSADKGATTTFMLDGYNATLEPRSYMLNSLGVIVLPKDKKNIWIGTDGDQVKLHATPELNTIKLRMLLPIGLQVADTDAVIINDQLV